MDAQDSATVRSAEPVVITGIGLSASVGTDRETVWHAVRCGQSRFRFLSGLRGIPDNRFVAATVDWLDVPSGQLKVVPLTDHIARETLEDAAIDWSSIDRERFGCAIAGHMGDTRWIDEQLGKWDPAWEHARWWEQWFPNTACGFIGTKYDLRGPRFCFSTACASSLVSVMAAVRSIWDDQCDIALAGGADAVDPLFVAGFQNMRVLAIDDDPQRACRPFDRQRKGFVFGEGGALFVLERLSHALRRNARIYAVVSAVRAAAQAHHVTSLDADGDTLDYLIREVLREANLSPAEVGYINAHGTGTKQNDAAEAASICRTFGSAAAGVAVSSTKSVLGHLINAAGAVELAITALALRDGFAPPTINLTSPDPVCRFDCLPLVGRPLPMQHALKLSLAFGGHLVAVILSRWNDPDTGYARPDWARAA